MAYLMYLERFQNLCKYYGGDIHSDMFGLFCNIGEDNPYGLDGFKAIAVWLRENKDNIAEELKVADKDMVKLKLEERYFDFDTFREYYVGINNKGETEIQVSESYIAENLDSLHEWIDQEYGENAEIDFDKFIDDMENIVNSAGINNIIPEYHYLSNTLNCEVVDDWYYEHIRIECNSYIKFPPNRNPVITSVIKDMDKFLDEAVDEIDSELHKKLEESIVLSSDITE